MCVYRRARLQEEKLHEQQFDTSQSRSIQWKRYLTVAMYARTCVFVLFAAAAVTVFHTSDIQFIFYVARFSIIVTALA